MNAQRLPPRLAAGQVEPVTRSLAEIRGLGVSFVRAAVNWQALQPQPPLRDAPDYDFTATDAWMAAVSRSALRWDLLGTGAPSPQWALEPASLAAGCAALSPPRPSAYAGMIAALARRYGRDGSFWREHRELPYQAGHELRESGTRPTSRASGARAPTRPPTGGSTRPRARPSAPWTRGRPSSLEAWLRSA